MKTIYLFKLNHKTFLSYTFVFLFTILLSSCKEDEHKVGAPFFNIENNPTGLSVDVKGTVASYVVRSNRKWKIESEENNDWVRTFPEEGEDDGIFKIIVDENLSFNNRVANFSFIVDGEEAPVLFRVEQESNIPFLDVETQIPVAAVGGEILIEIKTNVNWNYTLKNNSWLTETEKNDSQLKFIAKPNESPERAVILTIFSPSYPALSKDITITQSSGDVILEEDFSWLNYGSEIPYNYKNETRYDLWTEDEKSKGWLVTPNEFTGGQQVVYARPGFVKLGKTNYGGDLISPKLKIQGTKNVEVTFKAATYISAGGKIDDRILKVFALGAGTVSVSQFSIDNIPNSKAEDEAGVINDIWDPKRAYKFTITGATSDTQIRFLGGDMNLKGVGQGKNRIFLDDISVRIIQE